MMMKSIDEVRLLEYTSYKKFLEDYSAYKKASSSNFTFGSWAKSLKLGSTASLTRVINGDRIPGQEISDKLINYFGFEGREKEYFQCLVLLEKNQGDERLTDFLESRLNSLRTEKEVVSLDMDIFEIMTNWYYVAIREMVCLVDFREDATWIQSRLRLNLDEEEIKDVIDRLLKHGFLKRNAEGVLEHTRVAFAVPQKMPTTVVNEFFQKNLANTAKSLNELSSEDRLFTTGFFTVRRSDFPEIKEFMQGVNREIADKFVRYDDGDETVQFQMQFFPLTKKIPN